MIVDRIRNLIRPKNHVEEDGVSYEYCPRCQANLTLQKGYSNDLPYWICKGCGEMLINPEIDSEVSWICDGCGEMLNIQPGFYEGCGHWTCTECGFDNKIDKSELYLSEDEYQADIGNPYKGLSDDDLLALSAYQDIENVGGRTDVIYVRNKETGRLCVKKLLMTYDKSIYEYLKTNPVEHMPRIIDIFESSNHLIIIEEYIEGRTIADILMDGAIPESETLHIAKSVCLILDKLHNLPTPIVHRDVKPSNIIETENREVAELNDRKDPELIEKAILRDIWGDDDLEEYPLKEVKTYYGPLYKYYRKTIEPDKMGQIYNVEVIFQECNNGFLIYLYVYKDNHSFYLDHIMLLLRLLQS